MEPIVVAAYFHAKFPTNILALDLDSNCLELLTVVVSIKLWGHFWRNLNIQIYCDNMTAVLAINSGASRSGFIASCLRELWFWCAKYEILLRACHLPGVENRISDWLSRWHLDPSFYSDKFFNAVSGDITEVVLLDKYFMNDYTN